MLNLPHISFAISIISIVYMCIISYNKPFKYWFDFGYKYFGKTWIYYPIWYCQMCFSGQSALWCYLYLTIYKKYFAYNIFEHIYFISGTIFLTLIISKIYNRLDRL